MRFNKILNLINIILLSILLYFIIYGSVITSKYDLLLIFLFTSIFSFVNDYYSKINTHISFICFYVYVVCFLGPFVFVLLNPEMINKNNIISLLPKYEYVEFGFWKTFAYLDLIFIFTHIIFKRSASLNLDIFNYSKLLNKKILQLSIFIILLNTLLSYLNIFSLFTVFFQSKIYLFFIVLFYVISEKKQELYKYFYFFIFLCITISIYGGSRGGIIGFLMVFLIISLYLYGNFYIKKKQIFYFSLLIVLAFISYPIATVIRIASDSNLDFDLSVFFYADSFNPFLFLINTVLQRVSLLEYSFILNNNFYDPQFFEKYLTIKNLFLSTIDLVFPYSFSDVVASNNLLSNITYDVDYYEIKNNWTSRNVFLLDFNRLYTKQFFVLLTLFVLYLYSILIRLFSKNLLLHHILRIYLIVHLFEVFIFFGYDYWFRSLIHGLIPVLILYFLFKLSKFKKFMTSD